MNPDLLAAIVAFLRAQPGLVSSFGDAAGTPKFWADYAGPTTPALPYLVLNEPEDTLQFETADLKDGIGPTTDGTVIAQVFAPGKTQVRQLGEVVLSALTDPDLSINSQGVIYFRPTGHAFTVIAAVGPDATPTVFARVVPFRFILEPTYG
jgi:hypothetical protein